VACSTPRAGPGGDTNEPPPSDSRDNECDSNATPGSPNACSDEPQRELDLKVEISDGVYNSLNIQFGDESVEYSKITVSASQFYFNDAAYLDRYKGAREAAEAAVANSN
jgi:hypothetical protein